jgi:hypothetical protein
MAFCMFMMSSAMDSVQRLQVATNLEVVVVRKDLEKSESRCGMVPSPVDFQDWFWLAGNLQSGSELEQLSKDGTIFSLSMCLIDEER